MKLQFVTFEQAKALKELGFPQNENYEDRGYYVTIKHQTHVDFEGSQTFYEGELIDTLFQSSVWIKEKYVISAPTIELVAKFFRKEKDIDIIIRIYDNKYYYELYKSKDYINFNNRNDKYSTYEEALSAGIDKVIKMLKEEFIPAATDELDNN